MMTEEQFKQIRWPSRVLLRYVDGSAEELSGVDVTYESPADDPSSQGSLLFQLVPAKRGRHGRVVRLPEIARIEGSDGKLIWAPQRS